MESLGSTLSFAYCIPFAGMLLSIAICPLVNGAWWEKFKGAAVLFWSLLFLVPFAIGNGAGTALNHFLEVILGDYISFIVLLFGLFCVAGNIRIRDLSRYAESQCTFAPDRHSAVKLGWYYRSKYVINQTCDSCKQLEKTESTHDGIFHFPCFKYRRMPDTGRRSSAFNGIHAWCSIRMEFPFITGIPAKCGTASCTVLHH